jgi:outer membrane protein assembly factor BamB
MVRWVTGIVFAVVLTVTTTGCGGDQANEAKPSDPTTPSTTQAPTTSEARVFDPPKAFADDGVRVTEDKGALVGPELAYTPAAEGEQATGADEQVLTIRAISLADGEERWQAQTPVQRHLGLRGNNGFLRLTGGAESARLVWAGVHQLAGSGTQQDRFELVVGAIDAKTGKHTWSVRMPLEDGRSPEDTEVTIVGANDTHVAVAMSDSGDAAATGALVDVRAGKMTATPPGFTPIGLDGQTVVGRRATEGLDNGVAQGLDVATGQPRWAGNTRVDDLHAAVVTAGLAQFVEEAAFDSRTLLLSTADGSLKATLPKSHECSPAAQDVVVCVSSEQVTALDLTGKRLWSLPDQAADRIKPDVTAVYSGLVYGQANGGVILDARTGKDLVTDLEWTPDDVVPGFGIDRDDNDGLTSHRATG